MLPASISRALAIPANHRTGSIEDVEHVVILMQENRSFDHYFGSLRGVRGFNDPRPVKLPNGRSVWHQPPATVHTERYHNRGLSRDAEYVLPWYLNPKETTEYQAGTDHGWSSGHLAWNHGRYDQWVNQKQDVITMGYLNRQDVSFHYALADAFTICDSYFCSVFADTLINRIYLWTGTMDVRNAYGKKPNGPALDERHHTNGYTWTTYPERLQAKGISWKLYQGGTGIPGSPTDNFTDNSLEFFAQYQVDEGASPTSPLVLNGVSNHTLRELRRDVMTGKLAQVTWVVAPYMYSEHPEASPTHGAYYVNFVLDALTANPDVWSKTVLLIDYDENDGLFDHVVPPMPPHTQAMNAQGRVSDDLVDSLKDEFLDLSKYPEEMGPLVPHADPGGIQPVGLGPRVPMLVVSPWSKGGWVCSQTFDHTSVLQFLEKRFGVTEPYISKWRRAICGDLTSAFDFSRTPDASVEQIAVPEPLDTLHHPYQVPEPQVMPVQEPGTRHARPIPYAFHVSCRMEPGKVWLEFANPGEAGAAFYVYDGRAMQTPPRRYAISPGQRLSDYWPASSDGKGYELSAYGPNGYLFQCRGDRVEPAGPEVVVSSDGAACGAHIALSNSGSKPCTLTIRNSYGKREARHYTLAAGARTEDRWPLSTSSGWFDFSVTSDHSPAFLRRFAGHVETGLPSTSDPGTAMDQV